MALILPINPSRLEAGLKAYLEARFAADSVTVPVPSGEATPGAAAPAVVPGVSLETLTVNAPAVAILANDLPADAGGLYGDRLAIQIVVVTPLLVPGITLESHRALYDAVLACFPNRPRAGAASEDVEAWAELESELSAAVLAASGYAVRGWFAQAGRYAKGEDRVEQSLILKLGLAHPDV